MRRHAKASTAGSTQRQAGRLGRIFRGALATRDASLEVKGSGAPAARRLLVPASVFVAILILMVAAIPAGATKTHLFKETFGSVAQPSFSSPRSLAVDQATGDVLVMDFGANTISRYNPDGTPANFSGLGTNVIDGKGTGNCATVPADCDQTPQNGLGFGGVSESQIAVDNSGTATDGDIYVTQSSPNAINIFSKEGKYLGQLTAAGVTNFSEACGVAVDPSGAVYVGDYTAGIHKFVPAANPPVNADKTADFSTVTQPCALAAGAGPTAGFLFAAKYNGTISKIDSATGELKYTVSPDTNSTVSVDPGTGHVYGVTASTIKEFDASGGGSATMASGFSFVSSQGVAVRGSTGNVYVSSLFKTKVEVFGPLVTVPDVTTGSASNVEKTTATLHGTVNPDGVELTECKFEYGKTTSYGSSIPCAQSPATIGSGTSNVAVSANLSGLELGAEYHLRLVAKNAVATANGADKAFKLESPPVVKGQWAEGVVFSEATLKATIDPEGFATTYKFEWGVDTSYGHETAVKNVGSDKTDHTVSAFLGGLEPGTTYHYRVLATNSIGIGEGSDHTFTSYEHFVPNTSCPNQAVRTGPAASLSDCRAYEMVSPVDKNGGGVSTISGRYARRISQSSLDGEKLAFTSNSAFGDIQSGADVKQYIASRGPGGWSTHGISAPFATVLEQGIFGAPIGSEFEAFTPDLSSAWLNSKSRFELAPEEADNALPYWKFYRRDNTNDSYQALIVTDESTEIQLPGANKFLSQLAGYSRDLSHQVFDASGPLTPDASTNHIAQVYDFHDGELHLVSILPDGSTSQIDSSTGSISTNIFDGYSGSVAKRHVVSDDGSRVFWSSFEPGSGGGEVLGKVYLRKNPAEDQSALAGGECTEPAKACTVQISPAGRSRFLAATPDGSEVLLETERSIARVDVDAETSTPIAGELVGLVQSFGQRFTNGVLGASEDLSHVYFASREALAAGATAGKRNLYLDHEGTKTFIGTLSALDGAEANESEYPGLTAREYPTPGSLAPNEHSSTVSADGRHLAFTSNSAELAEAAAGYDNTDALTGLADREVYLYDAESGQLSCISCNPSGARPQGDPGVRGDLFGGTFSVGPTAARLATAQTGTYTPRTLSDDGSRVFLEAFDALLPTDTNGAEDVYEWEAAGTGDCEEGGSSYSPQAGGCLSLISTGQSPEGAEFVDATPNGESVFFRTTTSIDPRDTGAADIYVARVGGGYPLPPEPPACEGDDCQSVPAAPNDPTPASAGFRGPGNPKPQRSLRRNCRVPHGAKKAKRHPKRKGAKHCRRAKRGAGR